MSATLAASTCVEHNRKIKDGASELATGGLQSRNQKTAQSKTS